MPITICHSSPGDEAEIRRNKRRGRGASVEPSGQQQGKQKRHQEEESGGGVGRETRRKIKHTGDILILRQPWITDCNLPRKKRTADIPAGLRRGADDDGGDDDHDDGTFTLK